jgi:hypothetical protein
MSRTRESSRGMSGSSGGDRQLVIAGEDTVGAAWGRHVSYQLPSKNRLQPPPSVKANRAIAALDDGRKPDGRRQQPSRNPLPDARHVAREGRPHLGEPSPNPALDLTPDGRRRRARAGELLTEFAALEVGGAQAVDEHRNAFGPGRDRLG